MDNLHEQVGLLHVTSSAKAFAAGRAHIDEIIQIPDHTHPCRGTIPKNTSGASPWLYVIIHFCIPLINSMSQSVSGHHARIHYFVRII
eukprot:894067-Pleurochrysis_carterae.AAC.1